MKTARLAELAHRPPLLAFTLLLWLALALLCAFDWLGDTSVSTCLRASLTANGVAAPQVAAAGLPQVEPAALRPIAPGPLAPDTSSSSSNSELQLTSWQEVDSLIQRPSPLHGPQQKGGLPNQWSVLLDHMTNRDVERHGLPAQMSPAVYSWFARAATFNKSAGHSNRDLQSPVPPCHFHVDHRYRIVYVRSTKTAGTSISDTLGMKGNPLQCRDPRACIAGCRGRQVCLEYIWDPQQLRKVWNTYTVFSFVRNPWTRAISTWHHIRNRGVAVECQWSFPEFAEAPSAYATLCLTKPQCCKQRFGWLLEHTEPQAMCLFDSNGEPAVDFIGRVEHLEEDMRELVELINQRRPMGVEILRHKALPRLMVGDAALEGAADEQRRRSYAALYSLNSTTLEDIRSYFHLDFEHLRFPDSLEGLPPLETSSGPSSTASLSAAGSSAGGVAETQVEAAGGSAAAGQNSTTSTAAMSARGAAVIQEAAAGTASTLKPVTQQVPLLSTARFRKP